MKAVIYARQSTSDLNKAPDIAKQVELCKTWALKESHEVERIYSDNGYSGGDWNRPDWNLIVKQARGHQFKLVIVWSQDRIARDTEQFLFFYRNLNKCNVQIYSLNDGFINMHDLGERVKFTSIAQASEIFRLVTSEKVRKTYQAKKLAADQKGVKVVWGRKPKKYDVEKIMSLRRLGQGYRTIAKQVDASFISVRKVIKENFKENENC